MKKYHPYFTTLRDCAISFFFLQLRNKYPKDFTPKSPSNPIDLSKIAKFENGRLANDFAWQVLIGYPDGLQVISQCAKLLMSG